MPGGFPLVRAHSAALAVGGLLIRAALGIVGFMVVTGAITARLESNGRAESQQVDAPQPGSTIVLTVPGGSLGGNLTVVGESGCELATLTRWSNGGTSIVVHRSDGVSMSCFLNGNGSAALLLKGTAWATRINTQPDGTACTVARRVCEHDQPADNP
jgi:hypothetical protein